VDGANDRLPDATLHATYLLHGAHAVAQLERGDYASAIQSRAQMVRIAERRGDAHAVTQALVSLAVARAAGGTAPRAAFHAARRAIRNYGRRLESGHDVSGAREIPDAIIFSHEALAQVLFERGDRAGAIAERQTAAQLADANGQPGVAETNRDIARLYE
jgi:hypothetical protein